MKHHPVLLVFIFLFTALALRPAFAANLCDDSCDLSISFTNGGSLEAISGLTITFGTGADLNLGASGTINTNPQPASTDFSAGGSLSLNAGDSITFDAGGVLNLGNGGNIDYTDMNITASNIVISASGGTQSVSLHGNTILTVSDTLELNTDASVSGDVQLSDGITLGNTGSATISGSGTIGIQTGGSLTLGNGTVITDSNTILSTSDLSTSNITQNNTNINITGGLTLTPLTQDGLSLLEGMSLATADGNNCTVTNGECITADGAKYVVVGGELVVADNTGQLHIFLLLILYVLLFVRQSVFCIRQC